MGETTTAATPLLNLVLGGVPVLAAAATVVWSLAGHRTTAHTRLARPSAACALLSLTTTVTLTTDSNSYWKLAEAALLLLLIAAVTRWSPVREVRIAVPLAALAVATWPLPLIDGGFLERTGAASFWLIPALTAAAVGAYPRRVDQRRRAAVSEARRAQRLQLSRDLHDFVAHDVSGIVVQAQAARFVAATDPGQAVLALERIEKAGLNALEAMDRTVRMLDSDQEASGAECLPPGVTQLAALVDDFTAAGSTEAHLHLPPETADALIHAREAGAAAYRIVVEALTNIRRHAPEALRAEVRFTATLAGVELQVTNDAPRASPDRRSTVLRRHGGLGLPALTEHAEALGGTLTAGPHEGGWRLTAILPCKPPSQRSRSDLHDQRTRPDPHPPGR
ncbi:sensor histidine kinase [Streptomyces sp. NBC_00576]|uniref:sensor histidine kinase n=1 Tax=Streptomyces sp. NBC_00576 TaxID=2903665 RepID=UPI002E81388E|nr:histidine kinase [Streptomyces sp. NBC_00576]WUB74657.1 histidine kinase [Streptomyces sp. NBC_00576]